MGPGDTDAATAAAGLRLIQEEFLTRARRGDTGGRTATTTTSQAPIDLTTVDYLRAHVDEVIAHARTLTADARPAPHNANAYDWMRRQTAHLDRERRLAGETLVYRHTLEHALKTGEESVIRRHSCPGCGCWGLFWNQAASRASCVNRRCTTKTGHPSTWTLAQIAHHHITARESTARRAT